MSIQSEQGPAPDKVQQVGQGVGSVATTARETVKDTASEAATQVKTVAAEARDQVGRLAKQASEEIRQQAEGRSAQASQSLRTLSCQIDALINGRVQEAGALVRYLKDGQSRIASFAERLEQRGAQGVIDDVGVFARRRPGLFLLCAAGTGLAVGRMVRATAAGSPSNAGTTTYASYDAGAGSTRGPAVLTGDGGFDGPSGIESTGRP